jgi:thioredoxin 1
MNKTTGIIIGIIVIAIIAGVGYASTGGDDAQMADTKTNESERMEEKEAMMSDDGADAMSKGDEMMKSGAYEAYAPEKLARANTGDVVLFFHASWCPSCRGLNADIEKNLDSIPSDVSILKVDYDTETELKKKYGITYQHTLVQVTADGTLIKKWSGSPTLASVVSQIN